MEENNIKSHYTGYVRGFVCFSISLILVNRPYWMSFDILSNALPDERKVLSCTRIINSRA